jgi:Alpha galactosidase A
MFDVASRYLAAGYEYMNIDDCWSELERDENGKLVADHIRFPRGKKFLSDYVRQKLFMVESSGETFSNQSFRFTARE